MSLAFFQTVINYEFYAARQHSHMCVNIFIQLYAQNLCSWEKAKKVTLKCLGWFAECLSLVKFTGRIGTHLYLEQHDFNELKKSS